MYIKRFLLVSYIASIILVVSWRYKDKIVEVLELDINIDTEDVLLELYIPRINLREFVYNIDSSKNNVDYHVELLEGTDIENNLYFLASHSGGGRASYFDDLVYLKKGDIIWLNSNSGSYAFVVEEIFYIQKNGYFKASYNGQGNTLFLVTCSLDYNGLQLIVRSKLFYRNR